MFRSTLYLLTFVVTLLAVGSCDKVPSNRSWVEIANVFGGDASYQGVFIILRAEAGYPCNCDTLKNYDLPVTTGNIEHRQFSLSPEEILDLQKLASKIPNDDKLATPIANQQPSSDVFQTTQILASDGTGVIRKINLPGSLAEWSSDESRGSPELAIFSERVLEIRRTKCY